jgi:putative ABC transport system permease protein
MAYRLLLESLAQDLRHAARSLRGSRGFTATAVSTLAIGIGATLAIFSTVSATILRPLPFPRPDELISIRTRLVDGRVTTGLVSPVELGVLEQADMPVRAAAGVSAQPIDGTLIGSDGKPADVLMSGVTPRFFQVLGIPLVLGPGFAEGDFAPSGAGAPTTLVLSYSLWASRFGRDPAIVGSTVHIVELGGQATVVGVASPSVDLPHSTEIWFAQRIDARETGHVYAGILRMRPGTRIERLRSAAGGQMEGLARAFSIDAGREYVMEPLLASIVGDLGPTLLIVLGATALLLLLACVNVTNLLLARGAGRTREIAVRAALGASRARLVRQFLIEALVLASAGALIALGLAYAAVRLMLTLGASRLPRLDTVPFDQRVLLFALGTLLATTVVMGAAPAWRLARVDIRPLLNESGRSASSGRRTSRSMSALIVAEIALAIVMMAGAGWLVQSFTRLEAVDPGFTASGRLVVDVKPGRPFANPAAGLAWWQAVLQRVRAAPGVALAGGGSSFPLRADHDGTASAGRAGAPVDRDHPINAHFRTVTPGFFAAMGIRLLDGRDFTDDDRTGTLAVAIVNRAFARTVLGAEHPVAMPFAWGVPNPDPKNILVVVGVVQDVRYASLRQAAEPTFYLAQGQSSFYAPMSQAVVVAARDGDSRALVSGLRSTLESFDPNIALNFDQAQNIVNDTMRGQTLGMTLMLIFGVTALVLAAIGIYGVVAYTAAQRRDELATRVALGASGHQIFWLMMSAGQRVTIAAVVLGVAGALAAGRIVASSVFEMRAADPVVLIGATGVVAAVTCGATLIPAIRASRMDPVRALRSE